MNDLEKIILGGILQDISLLPLVCEIINPDMFELPLHRHIFLTMLSLNSEGKAINYFSVWQVLSKTQYQIIASELSKYGDMALVSETLDYARQLKTKYIEKQVAEKIKLMNPENIMQYISEIQDLKINSIENEKKIDIKDIAFELYADIKAGKKRGLESGFYSIDKNTKGFHKQNLIILASGPGKGKTSFALNIAVNILNGGHSVLLFSLEMSQVEIYKRMLSIFSDINSDLSDKELDDNNAVESVFSGHKQLSMVRFDYQGKMSDWNFRLIDDPQTLNTLIMSAEKYINDLKKKNKSLDLIIVDYLQLLSPTNERDTRERQVADFSYGLKRLAKKLDLPIIAIAQTNRLADAEQGRSYELHDLRESGAIEQSADMVLFLNKKKDTNEFKLDAKKYRHGKTFFCFFRFEANTTKFIEVEK